MKSTRSPILILMLALTAGGCVPSLDPARVAGTAAGTVAGKALAEKTPPSPAAAVVVQPKGGSFCGVMNALGGAPPVGADDRFGRPMAAWTVGVAEHGEKHCGWAAR